MTLYTTEPSSLVTFLAHGLDKQQAETLCSWLDVGPLILAVAAPLSIYQSTQKPVCTKENYDKLLIAKLVRSLNIVVMRWINTE